MTDSATIIFDIQRFSLHDGPGIRTTLFFKGCPLRCLWCQNPESHKPAPEIAFFAQICRQSFQCGAACEEDAILRDGARRVDFEKCTACGKCVAACAHRGLRLIGQRWDDDALLEEILKDEPYFDDSGGGVTLSGGEPMLHSGFLATWLPQLKRRSVHVTMETSGLFPWEKMAAILPYLDLIYFDLKQMDEQLHRRYTGHSNRLILENFCCLARESVALQARMPLIPGLNDGLENIRATAQFIQEQGQDTIHCLPYHNLGEAKIPRIDTGLEPLDLARHTATDLERIKSAFKKEGIDAVIYD